MISSRRFARIQSVVPGTSLLPVPFGIAATTLVVLAATLTFDVFTSTGRIAAHPWLSVGNLDDARAILGGILGAVSTSAVHLFLCRNSLCSRACCSSS